MKRMLALLLATAALLALLAGCGDGEAPAQTSPTTLSDASTPTTTTIPTPSQPAQTSSEPAESKTGTTPPSQTTPPVVNGKALLYIPFDLEQPDTYELPYTGALDASILLSGLASLTGWNCDVTKVDIFSGTARIDLAPTSLPLAYDAQTPNETFFLPTYADTVFLFLDSIAQTLTQNLGLGGVIFTQNSGEALVLDRLYTTVELFPADTLYRGSAYYRALLLDNPYSNTGGYPVLQLAGGMTLVYPNGFTIESETDTEFRVSAEDQVFITYRTYPLEGDAADAAEQAAANWAGTMSRVAEQSASEVGYTVSGELGVYRFHVTGYMAPERAAYYEISFMYDENTAFIDMETVIGELSQALAKYN